MSDGTGPGSNGSDPRPRGRRRASPARNLRQVPFDERAEVSVLGSILRRSQTVLDFCVQAKLVPDAFYVPRHRTIFEAMLALNTEGRAVDLVTLLEILERQGHAEAVGGQAYIERMLDNTPTYAHAETYIEVVQEKYLLRSMIEKSAELIDQCYTQEKPAEEILQDAERSIFDIAQRRMTETVRWPDLVKKTMVHVEHILQTRRGLTGLPTGYLDLDRMLLGLQPGDLIILAARPSMGKTSLAMNIVENIATGYRSCPGYERTDPKAVAVFSLEMSGEQLARRMICCHARVSSHLLARGVLPTGSHGALTEAADVLERAPIHVDDGAGLAALEVKSRARRMKSQHPIELVVIDYLQLMNYPAYAKDRQREIAAISGVMKAMAKELRLPVLVLSQFSRAPEGRHGSVPKLSDLRDSGAIEQDADVVLLLRRPIKAPDDPKHNPDDPKLSIVDVAKHRNGPTGNVELNFEEDYTRFMDRTNRPAPEEAQFGRAEVAYE